MGRLILPTTQNGDSKLFKAIYAKYLFDGASSILLPFFNEEKIIPGDVNDSNDAADAGYVLFNNAEKKSKKMFQIMMNNLNPIFLDHKVCVQATKAFYRSNPLKLTAFSVTIIANRVVYPKVRSKLCDSMMSFINYNAGLAIGLCPITAAFQTENKMDLSANLLALPNIKVEDEQYCQAVKDKEMLHKDMVLDWATVKAFNRAVGHFLMGQFKLNQKKCGYWGFTVDDSPQSAKERVVKFKKGQKRILYDVLAGSILQNTGNSNQQITKGKLGIGTPIILKPGEFWKVLRGYSELTSQSVGILLTGAITYLKTA